MDFRPLSLEDKPYFDKWFRYMQPKISEFTFTNLFLWQKAHGLLWTPWKEGALLLRRENNHRVFLPPVGFQDCEKIFQEMIEIAHREGISALIRIPEWARRFLPRGGVLIAERDHFDYVYKAQQLADLKGWRLDGKRAFVRKFQSTYPDWQFVLYEERFKEECERLLISWASLHKDTPGIEEEKEALLTLLKERKNLGVEGGVLLVGEKVIAFSFGERLNETTFVTHFEKADTSYIGAYQMINQQMAQHIIAPSYLFVNREQDLGIEGLRKAKKSYAPLKLIKKYRYHIQEHPSNDVTTPYFP
ncbi:MAG: phosphatidylglycerol lysyltransferase domain-containing protein [Brevinematales bacterium]|nr:phosphatidylglycerol lysyltransferase domain-containing protein [Brevinematales bacterium]